MRTTLSTLLLLAACSSNRIGPPDLGGLYDAVAQASDDTRNPVILIPGLLGSRLEDAQSGRVVWGAFRGDYANPLRPDGARLFALPMEPGVPLSDLVDGVEPAGALESLEVSIFGLPLNVGAYVNILLALGAGGYRDQGLGLAGTVDYGDEHFTCFQFAYDWRRDISENARLLDEFIAQQAAYVRTEKHRRFGTPLDEEVRFDIVAHSMGGLLTRYYLRYGSAPLPADGSVPEVTWAGAERIALAVLIATPNAGSSQAFENLRRGTKLGPFLPRYPPALVGTLPSAYQLMPRTRHGAVIAAGESEEIFGGLYSVDAWERFGWGLLDRDQDRVLEQLLPDVSNAETRRNIAREHLGKCLSRAEQFHRAMDVAATPPAGTELHLVVGDAVATLGTIVIDADTGRVDDRREVPGDGTVSRASALLDERDPSDRRAGLLSPIAWSRVMFFFEDHLGLTKDEAFIDNLLFLLLEQPRTY